MKRLALWIVLTASTFCIAQTCTPFQHSHRLVLVPVMLNGKGPYLFILDTAAQMTVVDSSIGKTLPTVPRKINLMVGGGPDVKEVDTRAVDIIAVDGLTTGPAMVLSYDMQPMRDRSKDIPNVVGILGSDILGTASSISVDFKKGCVSVVP